MTYENLTYDQQNGVATITLNRPQVYNALNPGLLDDIHDALGQAEADDQVRCLIITGTGNGFCSGADLTPESQQGARDLGRRGHLEPMGRFGRMALKLHSLDKPVIGAINGVTVGAGLALALGCDIRIASEQARFSAIFVKRGLIPDTGATWLLPRVVGMSRALEMAYTGRMVSAAEAERIGLVSQVVPPDQLMPTALELANSIAQGPPLAIELMKRVMQRGMDTNDLHLAIGWESWAQSICGQSEDNKEGVRAFLEKRQAVFQGR